MRSQPPHSLFGPVSVVNCCCCCCCCCCCIDKQTVEVHDDDLLDKISVSIHIVVVIVIVVLIEPVHGVSSSDGNVVEETESVAVWA